MPVSSIKEINKQMKVYINEASGISIKCKRKLIKLVEKHFEVDLPNEDFLNIDIEILENGNVKMRDDEYKTSTPVSTKEDLFQRFEEFQKEVDILLDKKATNFETIKKKNDKNNLIVVILLTFAIIIIFLSALRELFSGNLFGVLWIAVMVGYYVIPATGGSIKERYRKAWKYLKSKFKK